MGARSVKQKKSANLGIGGKILSRDDPKAGKAEQIIIQVKGSKTGVKDVRDLRGVLNQEKAATGVLISLQPPTRDRVAEAVGADFYEHKAFRKLTHCITGIYILGKGRKLKAECRKARQTHLKPPQSHINATSKPPQSLLIANRLRPQSHSKATLKPPQCDPNATPRLH